MKNTKVKNDLQNKLTEALASSKDDSFNFDLWAGQVRRQLLAGKDSGGGVVDIGYVDARASFYE